MFPVYHTENLLNNVMDTSTRSLPTKKIIISAAHVLGRLALSVGFLVKTPMASSWVENQICGSDKVSRSEFESPANASIFTYHSPITDYFPICQPHSVASGLRVKVEPASREIWTLASPPFQTGVPLCVVAIP